jgi:hypothetical protein
MVGQRKFVHILYFPATSNYNMNLCRIPFHLNRIFDLNELFQFQQKPVEKYAASKNVEKRKLTHNDTSEIAGKRVY